MAKVTTELQDEVRSNPKIKFVYFDADGNHYFNKHTVELHTLNELGVAVKVENKDTLPGVQTGIAQVKDRQGRLTSKRVPIKIKEIAKTMSRDEVLAAPAVANKDLSEKQEDDIIRQAQEILKKRAGNLAIASAPAVEAPVFDNEEYDEYVKMFQEEKDDNELAKLAGLQRKNPKRYCDEERKALTDVLAERKISA